MTCTWQKMIEGVVQHGCTEIILHPSQGTEDSLRTGICCRHNQNNVDQGHDIGYEGPDLFVLFEEINIMQCITHPLHLA